MKILAKISEDRWVDLYKVNKEGISWYIGGIKELLDIYAFAGEWELNFVNESGVFVDLIQKGD